MQTTASACVDRSRSILCGANTVSVCNGNHSVVALHLFTTTARLAAHLLCAQPVSAATLADVAATLQLTQSCAILGILQAMIASNVLHIWT